MASQGQHQIAQACPDEGPDPGTAGRLRSKDVRRRDRSRKESPSCPLGFVLPVSPILCYPQLSQRRHSGLRPVHRGGGPGARRHGRARGGLRRLKYAEVFPSWRCLPCRGGRAGKPKAPGIAGLKYGARRRAEGWLGSALRASLGGAPRALPPVFWGIDLPHRRSLCGTIANDWHGRTPSSGQSLE